MPVSFLSKGLPAPTWQWSPSNPDNMSFSRNNSTYDWDGRVVEADEFRRTKPYGRTNKLVYSPVLDLNPHLTSVRFKGHGWDYNGTDILQFFFATSNGKLVVTRNDSIINTNTTLNDFMLGTVANTTYFMRDVKVWYGLLIAYCERRESGSPNGVSILYSNDYGSTWTIAHDCPGIAGGVADGMSRGNEWNVICEEVTEGSKTQLYYIWADYLHKTSNPSGGQVGVVSFSRSTDVSTDWAHQDTRMMYERWEPGDGGLHIHTACRKSWGLLIFLGDVVYRNITVAAKFDWNNWTTDTVVNETIHGGYSTDSTLEQPSPQPVALMPGGKFGDHVASADNTSEVIFKFPEFDVDTEEIPIESLFTRYKNSASTVHDRYVVLDLHYNPGMGWTSTGDGLGLISYNGEDWAVFNRGGSQGWVTDTHVYAVSGGVVVRAAKPAIDVVQAIDVRMGGTNCVTAAPTIQTGPSGSSALDFVSWDGNDWVADTANSALLTAGQPVPENDDLKAVNTPFSVGVTVCRCEAIASSEAFGRIWLTSTKNVDYSRDLYAHGFLFLPKSNTYGVRFTHKYGPGVGGASTQNDEKGYEIHFNNEWMPFSIGYTGTSTTAERAWTAQNAGLSNNATTTFYTAWPVIPKTHGNHSYMLEYGASGEPNEQADAINLPASSSYSVAFSLYRPLDLSVLGTSTGYCLTFKEDVDNFISIRWNHAQIVIDATFGGVAQPSETIATTLEVNQYVDICFAKEGTDISFYLAEEGSSAAELDTSVTFTQDFVPTEIHSGNIDKTDNQAMCLGHIDYFEAALSSLQYYQHLARASEFSVIVDGLTELEPLLPISPVQAKVAGARGKVSWSFTGTPPTGLSIDSATGLISGTPSVEEETGTFQVVANDGFNTASKSIDYAVLWYPTAFAEDELVLNATRDLHTVDAGEVTAAQDESSQAVAIVGGIAGRRPISNGEYFNFDGNDDLQVASDFNMIASDPFTVAARVYITGTDVSNSTFLISGGASGVWNGINVALSDFSTTATEFRVIGANNSQLYVGNLPIDQADFNIDTGRWINLVVTGNVGTANGDPHDIGQSINNTNHGQYRLAGLAVVKKIVDASERAKIEGWLNRLGGDPGKRVEFTGTTAAKITDIASLTSTGVRFRLQTRFNLTAGSLLSHGGFSPSAGWFVAASGNLNKKLINGDTISCLAPSDLADGSWHEIEYDFTVTAGNDPMTLHSAIVDSVDVTGDFTFEPAGAVGFNEPAVPLSVSGRDNGAVSPFNDGLMDYINLYNVTADEWVFDYDMRLGFGSHRVGDKSGQGNHGTKGSGVIWTEF